jgi:hypothetical protein
LAVNKKNDAGRGDGSPDNHQGLTAARRAAGSGFAIFRVIVSVIVSVDDRLK